MDVERGKETLKKIHPETAKLSQNSAFYLMCCFMGLFIVFLSGWLLNTYIFPYYDTVLPWIREISTACNGLILIAIALAATWKPRVFSHYFIAATALCFIFGLIISWAGIHSQSVGILIVGASLTTIGRGILSVFVGLACVRLSLKNISVCVAGAFFLSYLVRGLFLYMPPLASIIVYAIGPLISLALLAPYIRPLLASLQSTETPAQAIITQPSSFLPFGHHLFMCLLLFRIAYGYALTLGEVGGVPPETTLALVPLALVTLVAIVALINKKPLNPDILFSVSFLFVVAGFLLVAVPLADSSSIVNTLLMSGVGCFDILVWVVLINLGSKSKSAALSVFAWGLSMNSLGVIIGANFGRLTNAFYGQESLAVSLIAASLVLLFVAYVAVVLKPFSFRTTIEGIVPEHKPVTNMDSSLLETRCAEIGKRYGLTAREKEVFGLLARGRNGRYIQNELVVSYNTVKAHVRHIYTKLGIHTQQELIDEVEQDT